MPVFLADGRRLGFVSEVGHALDYLHVQQGRLLIRDWYVPIEAVQNVDTAGVVLKFSVNELRSRRYNVPPAEYLARQGATPGYEYTGGTDPSESDAAIPVEAGSA
jgi:hypothetical protein